MEITQEEYMKTREGKIQAQVGSSKIKQLYFQANSLQ